MSAVTTSPQQTMVVAEQCSSTECQVTNNDEMVVGSFGVSILKTFANNRCDEQHHQQMAEKIKDLTKQVSHFEKEIADLKNNINKPATSIDLPNLYEHINLLLKPVNGKDSSPVTQRLDLTRRRPASQKSRTGGIKYSRSVDYCTLCNNPINESGQYIQRNRSQSDVSIISNQSSGYQSNIGGGLAPNQDNTGSNVPSGDNPTSSIKHQTSTSSDGDSDVMSTIPDNSPPVTTSTPIMQRPMSHLYDIDEDDANSTGTDIKSMIIETLFSMESVVRVLMMNPHFINTQGSPLPAGTSNDAKLQN